MCGVTKPLPKYTLNKFLAFTKQNKAPSISISLSSEPYQMHAKHALARNGSQCLAITNFITYGSLFNWKRPC